MCDTPANVGSRPAQHASGLESPAIKGEDATLLTRV